MTTKTSFVDETERQRARTGVTADFYAEALKASRQFRREYQERANVVKSHEMPMERTADGLIKHIINEGMNTKECCIDIYMQFIPGGGGATGTSRHLSEEVAFVVEGTGYDLHYDVNFRCEDEFIWEWDTTPKKFEWAPGDFIYIPPYCGHKRFNAGKEEARVVVVNSRMMKAMGFDWFDQLEPAEGFEDLWVPPAD